MRDCPFCGSRPHFYTRDNDSFVKDVVVQCGGCFAEVTTSVDWQPFYANGSDHSGFNEAVAKAAADVWNRRPSNEDNRRKDVLLKATYDLLKKCNDSHYVLSAIETTVFYDDAECDGSCLMDDIAIELGIYEG